MESLWLINSCQPGYHWNLKIMNSVLIVMDTGMHVGVCSTHNFHIISSSSLVNSPGINPIVVFLNYSYSIMETLNP